MGWLQPWPSSSFVLKLNTSTISRTWDKCMRRCLPLHFPTFTCPLFHTSIFSHIHTSSHIHAFVTETFAYLLHIAAHLALVVLQHLCSQLLVTCVFRSKIPNLMFKDSTFVAHPVQQDLLEGHLSICWDITRCSNTFEIFQDMYSIQRYSKMSKSQLTSPPWALASVFGMSMIRFSSPAPFPAKIYFANEERKKTYVNIDLMLARYVGSFINWHVTETYQ